MQKLRKHKVWIFDLYRKLKQKIDLLGTMIKIWAQTSTINKVMKSICVLWLRRNLTMGVLTMKHSMYLGSSSIWINSAFIFSGKDSLTNSIERCPSLFTADLLAPFKSRALTGLVDLASSTLRIARCKGVKPNLS